MKKLLASLSVLACVLFPNGWDHILLIGNGLHAEMLTHEPATSPVLESNEAIQVETADGGFSARADSWLQEAKLTASDAEDDDQLGRSIAMSADGSTVVVGAYWKDGSGTNRGVVYVYEVSSQTGWVDATENAKLTASVPADHEHLGRSVAVSSDGTTVAVGVPFRNGSGTYRGAVYIYERPDGGWVSTTETARLIASDAADSDYLGFSVSVSWDGATVTAGAYGDDSFSGSAYVFKRSGTSWSDATQTAKLTAEDRYINDYFGGSVAVSGDGSTVAAGAFGESNARGAVYVFERPEGGWTNATEDGKLTASDGLASDSLGYSVAVNEDGTMVVSGAPYEAEEGHNRGSAYVFTSKTWSDTTETGKLTASDASNGDKLGYSVAISSDGSTIAAGAERKDGTGNDHGAVYLYERYCASWASATEDNILMASDGGENDYFGHSVAISADGFLMAAGAYGANLAGVDGTDDYRGAAYVYQRVASGCPDCSESHLVLQKMRIPGNSICECVVAETITIGPCVVIRSGAVIRFKAPVVRILSDFHAEESATVWIDQE